MIEEPGIMVTSIKEDKNYTRILFYYFTQYVYIYQVSDAQKSHCRLWDKIIGIENPWDLIKLMPI